MESEKSTSESQPHVPPAPKGWQRIAWLGPGFLWMVSAAGSGELLFTPRVAAQYGYTLLWALLLAVLLKWFINREVGRFAVCTGATVLEGYKQLPGPKNWAVWLIIVPQLFVAVTALSGMAAAAATALILFLPGDVRIWMVVSIVTSTVLVVWGRYKVVENMARFIAIALAIASLTAAIAIFPNVEKLVAGLIPTIPDNINYSEILPWLGYMLSGAAGLIWYSYWITSKGYGASKMKKAENGLVDTKSLNEEDRNNLKGWIKQMTLDTTVAVVGALIVTIAFLILGAELLFPKNLVPEEDKVAETLGQLLGGVFGTIGFWFMVIGVFIGFWDTVLSDQDGFGRMFANGTKILGKNLKGRWQNEEFLRKFFVIVVVTILPIVLYLIIGEPIALLKMAGAVEAMHIPVVTGLTLYLNQQLLPKELRAAPITFFVTVLAGLFFVVFAGFYVLQLLGVVSSSN